MSSVLRASVRLLAVSALSTFSFAIVAEAHMSVQMACSGEHLSKMTTMIGGMPEGSHKSEMYQHLAMVNSAMAKDGTRGCRAVMTKMHRHHEHHMNHQM